MGDRLSSVSTTVPAPSPGAADLEASRLLAEMRDQVFTLTTSLDRERSAKEEALQHIQALRVEHDAQQAQMSNLSPTPTQISPAPIWNTAWGFPKSTPTTAQIQVPEQVITPATPLPDLSPLTTTTSPGGPDSNANRIKAWGFPRNPTLRSTSADKKRESFFGLSSNLHRPSDVQQDEDEDAGAGVDLPLLPFTASPVSYFSNEKLGSSSPVKAAGMDRVEQSAGSVSALALTATSTPPSRTFKGSPSKYSPMPPTQSPSRISLNRGVDMRESCACCLGDVWEF